MWATSCPLGSSYIRSARGKAKERDTHTPAATAGLATGRSLPPLALFLPQSLLDVTRFCSWSILYTAYAERRNTQSRLDAAVGVLSPHESPEAG